jgi:hypothetical protein
MKYELERNKTGLVTIFKFSNIACFIQLLYHAIAAVSPPRSSSYISQLSADLHCYAPLLPSPW